MKKKWTALAVCLSLLAFGASALADDNYAAPADESQSQSSTVDPYADAKPKKKKGKARKKVRRRGAKRRHS